MCPLGLAVAHPDKVRVFGNAIPTPDRLTASAETRTSVMLAPGLRDRVANRR